MISIQPVEHMSPANAGNATDDNSRVDSAKASG